MAVKSKNKSAIVPQQINVPVLFNLPVEMPSVYATNIIVQMSEHEVVLAFYEAQPPFDPGSGQIPDSSVLQQTGIRADCVARVTVARGRFEGFVNAMQGMVKLAKAAEKKAVSK